MGKIMGGGLICLSILVIFLPSALNAQINNGSFETGDLTGWTVNTGAVEVIQSSNFNVGVPVPNGVALILVGIATVWRGTSETWLSCRRCSTLRTLL